jgi:hypothetical protein
MKKLVLIVAVAVMGQAYAADFNYGVTPESTWLGYINVFDQADNFQFGFPESTPSTASANWAPGPAQPLTMSPNTRLYDENVLDPFWVDQTTFEATLVSEFNYYQEAVGAVGNTVQFDYEVVANSLPAGYEAVGFIKVLDGFSSWATYQIETADLTAGSKTLSLTVDGSGITGGGVPFIQAGFWVKGAYVSSSDPVALTGVEIIPEPATIGLMGIAGLGMFVARRRLKI